MRRMFGSILVLAALSAPLRAAEYVELTGFQLIDGSGASARPVQRLVAKDGVIVAIVGERGEVDGELPSAAPGDTWTRTDLAGKWVMPGLVDTHVHVARFPEGTRERAEQILRAALRGGVVAVRDLAGDARTLAEIERANGAGDFTGPTVVFSALFGGPDIFKQGPTAMMAQGRPPGEASWARVIERRTDVVRAVAEARGSGARAIKLYGDLTRAQVRAVAAEAKRQGMMTVAHATVFPAGPGDLVDAGVGTLSHAPYLVWEAVDDIPDDYRMRTRGPWATVPPDHPRLMALYRRMAERGVFLDATLYVYQAMKNFSPEVKADWADEAFVWGAKATALAHQAGVRVTTGTDWFEPSNEYELPHTHDEMQLLVEHAGFTPMDAIVAATRHGAAALGLEDSSGTVQVGRRCDLLVLKVDPVRRISATNAIARVYRAAIPVR